jgi:hypothetical protein
VPVSASDELRIIARERMKVLAIGFYVRGGMMLLFGFFFLIYVAMFAAFSFIPQSSWNQRPARQAVTNAFPTVTPAQQLANPGPPPAAMFRIMAAVMGGVVLLAWVVGALTLYSGNCIRKRKHRTFVYVMAGLNCFFIPYGALLGVFTFIVLGSPEATAEWNDPAL